MEVIKHLVDAAQGKHPVGTARSSKWPAVRKAHLVEHPVCEVCGGSEKLKVHHVRPFHLHPDFELDPRNLLTLCEAGRGGLNCHLAIGHLGDFKSFNVDARANAAEWAVKIKTRPYEDTQ